MPIVHLAGTAYTLESGENLLAGMERHGVSIPSSCRSGVCQSCLVRATDGQPPEAAQKGLKPTQRMQGLLLACCCAVENDLEIALEGAAVQYDTVVLEVTPLSDRVSALHLAVPAGFEYFPGQFINLIRPGNVVRSYSLASVPGEDDVLTLHVAAMPGGAMSTWVHRDARPGDTLQFSGPLGGCFYTGGRLDQPMLLLGTGTGLAPLYGILRDALAQGHSGPIHLFHGSPVDAGLYLHEAITALAEEFPQVAYHPCILESPERPGVVQGDLGALALQACGDLSGWRVYLCGNPDLVRLMQRKCFLAGAAMADILADAFLPAAAPATAST
jgi:ferredoxin-NADP reductase/ferredoxin